MGSSRAGTEGVNAALLFALRVRTGLAAGLAVVWAANLVPVCFAPWAAGWWQRRGSQALRPLPAGRGHP